MSGTLGVPSMDEVREATGRRGLVAASLFAGCGGSSLGYRLAGYRVAYANEIDPHAIASYAANADPRTRVDDTNVEMVTGASLLEAARSSEIDVLDASPPCQDFSTAGRRNMAGDNARLYHEAVRLVGEVRPRAFAFENVAGLARGQAIGHLRIALDALAGHGYSVSHRLLDASWHGVPQARLRLLVIGLRDDVEAAASDAFPAPFPERATVNEALPEVPYFAPAPTILKSGFDGGVTGAALGLGGIEDFARLCSFPADFDMPGPDAARLERLGNAVPPLFARAWAESIADALTGATAEGATGAPETVVA